MTPNGDGINDYFIIKNGKDFTQVEFTILNRWGNTVYYNNNYKDNFGGKLNVSDGVYFYVANLWFAPNFEFQTYTGTITINQ